MESLLGMGGKNFLRWVLLTLLVGSMSAAQLQPFLAMTVFINTINNENPPNYTTMANTKKMGDVALSVEIIWGWGTTHWPMDYLNIFWNIYIYLHLEYPSFLRVTFKIRSCCRKTAFLPKGCVLQKTLFCAWCQFWEPVLSINTCWNKAL